MPTRLSWTTTQHAAPQFFIRSWPCHHDIPIQIGGSLGGISERLSRSKKQAFAIIQGGDTFIWPMNWEAHALRDGWTMLKILWAWCIILLEKQYWNMSCSMLMDIVVNMSANFVHQVRYWEFSPDIVTISFKYLKPCVSTNICHHQHNIFSPYVAHICIG